MSDEPLFRREVLDERQAKSLGTVLLLSPRSERVFAGFALVAMLAVIGLLFLADYSRRARIEGWLVPQGGLVQVFAPRSGVITELHVEEGSEVREGQPLLVLSSELQSATLGATHSEIARRLADRRGSLVEEREQIERLGKQRERSLAERLRAVRSERQRIQEEIELRRGRLELAKESEMRQEALRQQGLISDEGMRAAEDARLEQHAELSSLEQILTSNERLRLTLEGELRDLPIQSQAEIAEIDRNIASLDQDLAETEALREIVVPAPATGIVSAIQVERGTRSRENVPLLSILPGGSKLEAHLFSPSRGVGFVRTGQRVLVRYEAYPYQRFGHHPGVVSKISRSAINPSDLPPHLAGLTSIVGAGEPIYRITVQLESQHIQAYGEPVPLQAGMQLQADVVIETRRLVGWVLDPLYTLTRK